MKIGDCLAALRQIDGKIFFVDWDASNNRKRINYISPGEPATPKKFSDDITDNPDRLILDATVEVEDDIRNNVIVEGNEGFKSILGVEGNYTLISFKNKGQIFRASDERKILDSIAVKASWIAEDTKDLRACIYKALTNIPHHISSVNIYKNGSSASPDEGTADNIKDENFDTYIKFNSLAQNDYIEIVFNFDASYDFYAFLYKIATSGNLSDFEKKVFKWNGSSWDEIASVGTGDNADYKNLYLNSSINTTKIKFYFKNTGSTTVSLNIYELGNFIWGYDENHLPNVQENISLGEAVIQLNKLPSDAYPDYTIFFDFNKRIELEPDKYYACIVYGASFFLAAMESISIPDDMKKRIGCTTYGKWFYDSNYPLAIKLGFEKMKPLRYTAKNQTSINMYGQKTFKFSFTKLLTYEIVKKMAEYFANYYSEPNKFVEIEVEGINSLSLSEKVKLYLHSLSKDNDLVNVFMNVQAYEHEITPAGRWRTYLHLGRKTEDIIEGIIAKLMKGVELS